MAHKPAKSKPKPAKIFVPRTLIIGGPKCGKTSLATLLDPTSKHTDDAMHLGWSEASAEVATWFDAPAPWVIEGVAIPRALRKWLLVNPIGKPADRIIYLTHPLIELTKGQITMTKGIVTVWSEIEPALRDRGVEIVMVDAAQAAHYSDGAK